LDEFVVHLPTLINSSRRAESCLPLPASRSKVAEVDGDEENTDLETAVHSQLSTYTQFKAPLLPYLELLALFAAPKLGEAEDGVLVLNQAPNVRIEFRVQNTTEV
jgi:hypothetical protein